MPGYFPSVVYAIEKTAAGTALIEQNCRRFQVENVISIHGSARRFCITSQFRIASLSAVAVATGQILDTCSNLATGVLVLALATLEHLNTALGWLNERGRWNYQLLQVQLSRSVPVGPSPS